MARHSGGGNALDLLEREDIALRSAFVQVLSNQGPSVEERAEYGDLAKTVIRRVATREAALVDVSNVAADLPELGELSDRLEQNSTIRRPIISRVEKMSRGVQGINLNTGQDFDEHLTELMQVVGSEIEWDLDEALPTLRNAVNRRGVSTDLSGADQLVNRAPTNLNPRGPRWYERAPLIARLITVYDHLRDFPRAVRDH